LPEPLPVQITHARPGVADHALPLPWKPAAELAGCRLRWTSRSNAAAQGRRRGVPTLRPVVSSPPRSEPDVRLPPHPALHEHNERSRARAADDGHGVPSAVGQRCAGVHRRPPPINRAACPLDPFALWTALPPSPVGRDSHDYYGSSATPRRQRRTVRLPQTQGSGGHRRGRFPRSLINRSAGSAPSCTAGTSPRATATRSAASPVRARTGRTRRPSPRTRTERPDSP
jgi:hypothetical protein